MLKHFVTCLIYQHLSYIPVTKESTKVKQFLYFLSNRRFSANHAELAHFHNMAAQSAL